MSENSTHTDHYGLIGYPLTHSFSATFFKQKFERENIAAKYLPYEIENLQQLPELIEKENLKGLSVTLPYKEQIFQYLNYIDPIALQIGAVNTIRITDDKKIIGYNTDYIGFMQSLQKLLDKTKPYKALVFGSGGASKAVQYALNKMKITYKIVSRKQTVSNIGNTLNTNNTITYNELNEQIITEHNILINTTPIGMFPNINDCIPIPYNSINEQHILFDLIYNPQETLFLRKGRERGANIQNGLEMLHLQAEKAWQIFISNPQYNNNLIKL